MPETTVAVVGAGPVGLLAANLLAAAGIGVVVFEKRSGPVANARAIGITPPSLEIFESLGLAEALVARGVRVRESRVYGTRLYLGSLDFHSLGSRYPFILSLPQGETERLLADAASRSPHIRLRYGHEVTRITFDEGGRPLLRGTGPEGSFEFQVDFLAGCDGGKSVVRSAAGIAFRGAAYGDTFLMGDFVDRSGWGEEVRMFFTRQGSVESFPMPGGLRRFVLRTEGFVKEGGQDYLVRNIALRAGLKPEASEMVWESAFGVQRFTAESYSAGRVFLAGDAAHLMSPIGGQNMNTGFADAEFLARVIGRALKNPDSLEALGRAYTRVRRRAARRAASRAWLMMRAGTGGGAAWSAARGALVALVFASPLKKFLPRFIAMYTIPACTISKLDARTRETLFPEG